MTEPMYRRPRHNGDEQDAFSRSARRDGPCSLQRAGIVHKTKTRAARRARHTTRQDLRQAASLTPALFAAARRADAAGIVAMLDLIDA